MLKVIGGILLVLTLLVSIPASVLGLGFALSGWIKSEVGPGFLAVGGFFLGMAAGIGGWVAIFCFFFAWLRFWRTLKRPWWRGLWLHLRPLSVGELARRLALEPTTLQAFTPRYRIVHIPKRTGGQRQLVIPDAETKNLQRKILRRVLGRLPAHPAAHAYERGRSIATNAAPHVGRAVVVRCDLVDFFPQTSSARIAAYFRAIGWSAAAAAILTRLTTHEGGLPQGAPTSPRLANLVNRGLDRRLTALARRYRGTYTRYADDLTFSFPEDWPCKVRSVIQGVRAAAKTSGYRVHGRPKLRICRPHQRQQICGIMVNDGLDLPRAVRRRLRAAAHHHAVGLPATLTQQQLAGWQAYRQMIVATRPQIAVAPVRPRRKEAGRHL